MAETQELLLKCWRISPEDYRHRGELFLRTDRDPAWPRVGCFHDQIDKCRSAFQTGIYLD